MSSPTVVATRFQSQHSLTKMSSTNSCCASISPMPRPKLHRAICDCLDCITQPTSVSDVSKAARQEPPPKCLVIYTNHAWPVSQDGTAATPASGYESVPHLDNLAKAGSCGLVLYRETPHGMVFKPSLSALNFDSKQAPFVNFQVGTYRTYLSSCIRYNNLQTGFMSTSVQACLLAKEAGMQILPLLCPSQAQCNSVQKGLSGWPPPDLMAHTVKTVLGFAGSVGDGTSYLTAANDDDDSIDLLFLHIAWDKAPHGSGCNPSGASQLDAGTLPLQHTQHASALPAGIAPTAGSDDWISAGSSAALHQWLDDVIKLLFQYPNFSSSVLTAVLLRNQEADDMLQASSPGAVFEDEDFPRVVKPQQSHCISKMQLVSHSLHQSSLMIQHLPAVVRRDNVQTLSSLETMRQGGGGCILAEHVLPELAYKLGRAAKYGA